MKHSLLAVGLISLPVIALAEDNTVVVTASRYEQPITNTLAAVTVLTEEDIEQSGDNDLSSLLASVTSTANKTSGGLGTQSSITLRGIPHSRMIVLIDGVRATNATAGATTLEAISLANVERIEIVRGPVSSLYGADGMGGVIQIFTKSREVTNEDHFISAEYGSHNYQQWKTGFRAFNEKNQLQAGFGYLLTDGFDYAETETNGNEDDDGFQQWSANVSLTSKLTEQLEMTLTHAQTSSVVEYDNSFCTSDCDTAVITDMDLQTTSLGLNYQANNGWNWQNTLGRNLDDKFNREGSSTFTSESLSYNSLLSKDFQTVEVSLGTDGSRDEVSSSTDYDETERTNLGVYSQATVRLGEQRLAAGGRIDANSDYGTIFTGNLSLSSFIISDIEAIASYGTAYGAPSFDYLYYPGYSNPDLEPEESATAEIALRQISDNHSWRVSAYRTDASNLIVSTASTSYVPENVDEAVMQGIEGEFSKRLAATTISFNAGYVDAKDADDDRLSDVPEWTANVKVTQQLNETTAFIEVHGEGSRISSDEELEGFVTLSSGADYHYGTAQQNRLYARVDNVLDENDESNLGYNTPGRTFKVGIEYHL